MSALSPGWRYTSFSDDSISLSSSSQCPELKNNGWVVHVDIMGGGACGHYVEWHVFAARLGLKFDLSVSSS